MPSCSTTKIFLLACLLTILLTGASASFGDQDALLRRRGHPVHPAHPAHPGSHPSIVKEHTHQHCMTISGTKKPKQGIETITRTITKHVQQPTTVRVFSTVTVTPAPSTVSKTDTLTVIIISTDVEVTDVLTVHTTPTIVATSIVTLSPTVTVDGGTITSTSTSTSTVPTAAGFTPLASQINALGHTAAMRRRAIATPVAVVDKRDPENASLNKDDNFIDSLDRRNNEADERDLIDLNVDVGFAVMLDERDSNTRNAFRPKGQHLYEQSVECKKTIKSVTQYRTTITAAALRTTTAIAAIVTSSITSLTTVTSTVALPHVTRTSTLTDAATTITNTITTATTSTTSTTSTATVAGPTVTLYAACEADNLVNKIDGNYIDGGSGAYNQAVSTAASKQGCCAQCQQVSNCMFFAFSAGTSSLCLIFTPSSSSTCPAPPYTLYSSAATTLARSYVCGNGACGQITL